MNSRGDEPTIERAAKDAGGKSGRRGPPERPDLERRARVGRQLRRLLFVLVFGSGSIYALFGADGVADRMRLAREQQRLTADVDARLARIERLQAAKEGLRVDPMSRERIAREQLGYVRPGEIVFLLPDGP